MVARDGVEPPTPAFSGPKLTVITTPSWHGMRVWINNSDIVYNIRALYPPVCLKFLQISRSLGKPFESTAECFVPPAPCAWEFTRAPCMLFGIPARSSRLGGVYIVSQMLLLSRIPIG